MPDLSITPPTVGENNDTADPELRTALAVLVAGANAITTDQFADNAFTAPKITPPALQSITLTGYTWANGTLRFYKTSHGLVYLVADALVLGTTWSTPQVIGTMPAGYRPGTKIYTHWVQWFGAGTGPYTDSQVAVVSIDTDGTLTSLSTVSAGFLDPYTITPQSVSYRAEN